MNRRVIFHSLLAFFAFALPSAARACTVCFGQDPASGLTKGFYWGVVLLLSLPFMLFAGIAGLIFYNVRRRGRSGAAAQIPTSNPL